MVEKLVFSMGGYDSRLDKHLMSREDVALKFDHERLDLLLLS